MQALAPARPLPIESPLPSREGARGRGFAPMLRPCPGKAGLRQEGMRRFSSIDNPLPLPPSRRGRGDLVGVVREAHP
ncbi:hypothetical protein P409_23975 [Inquilinus limosus MP06]|uniref:Uncharacterized protein n=1 Tax=Inquilinus limosus MP06 TaxID=1398085 RepID=A0A0A0D1S2_9PROT|nr:hypothetical protein P409_23975 [Inquilinus limosus MP06]